MFINSPNVVSSFFNESKQNYMSLNDFNHQPIAAHQSNLSTIHGIFALLRNVNGIYRSRYEIESYERSKYYSNFSIDQYYEYKSTNKYWSIEGKTDIKIIFDAPFHTTGYAICNGVQTSGNTFPTDWKLIGINTQTREEEILDSQTGQRFCGPTASTCSNEIVKGYIVKTNHAFKEYIFRQTRNSQELDHLFFRSLDLFGTLCGRKGFCNIIFHIPTCKRKNYHSSIPFLLFFCLND